MVVIAKLTERQKRFADYYIKTGNATESAIKAGYSKKTAKEIGCENLTKPNINEYVKQRLGSKDKKRIASQDEVLELYTKIARGEEQDVSVNGMGKEKKVSPALRERIKALDALAKRYGLDKQEDSNSSLDSINENIKQLTEIIKDTKPERKIEDFE